MKYEGLIRRARELAALAEKATPGPWVYTDWSIRQTNSKHRIAGFDILPDGEDGELLAAAPDMARLLAEMAEVLESVWEEAIQDAIDAITCKSCNGRGRITNNPNSQECPDCGGSGTIDDPLAEMAHNE